MNPKNTRWITQAPQCRRREAGWPGFAVGSWRYSWALSSFGLSCWRFCISAVSHPKRGRPRTARPILTEPFSILIREPPCASAAVFFVFGRAADTRRQAIPFCAEITETHQSTELDFLCALCFSVFSAQNGVVGRSRNASGRTCAHALSAPANPREVASWGACSARNKSASTATYAPLLPLPTVTIGFK